MATIEEHNKLLKIVFGGTKFFRHALSREEINKMTMVEKRFPASKLPVCEHCESLAYWGKGENGGVGVCPKCGTITKNPITFAEYYVKGYDIDKTSTKNTDKEIETREILLGG